jgi:hypothetical protein
VTEEGGELRRGPRLNLGPGPVGRGDVTGHVERQSPASSPRS